MNRFETAIDPIAAPDTTPKTARAVRPVLPSFTPFGPGQWISVLPAAVVASALREGNSPLGRPDAVRWSNRAQTGKIGHAKGEAFVLARDPRRIDARARHQNHHRSARPLRGRGGADLHFAARPSAALSEGMPNNGIKGTGAYIEKDAVFR